MRLRRRLTGLALALTAANAALASVALAEEPNPTGRLLVTLEGPRKTAAVVERHRLDVEARIPAGNLLAVDPAPGETRGELRRELLADPAVERVDIEYFRELRYIPNDPAYAAPDSLNAPYPPNGDAYQWNLRKSGFESGWETSSGSGATVAIVDTGVSTSSPDLTQIAAQADHDPTAPTGATSDENGHGSHVAGLACANSDNGYGIASAGFDCRIIAEKLDVSGNNLTDASIVAAIYDAANKGADVINLSLGGRGPSGAMQSAIEYAWSVGAIMIASARNSYVGGSQGYPAEYVQPTGTAPDIHYSGVRGLVVTMAQYEGANAGAGYGTGVSVAAYGDSSAAPAPGHPNGLPGIFSTWPANTTTRETAINPLCPLIGPFPCRPRTSFSGDSRFAYLFGTSMAAPQVSGLVALIRSLYPDMSSLDIIRSVKLGASGKGTWGEQLGWGIIDAGAAVELSVIDNDNTAPSSNVKVRRKSRSRRIKLRIDSSDSGPAGKPAAGIENVSVYVSKNGRPFNLLRTTGKSRFRFKGKRGARYRFYSRALDKAGNREPAPRRADSSTKILRRR